MACICLKQEKGPGEKNYIPSMLNMILGATGNYNQRITTVWLSIMSGVTDI